MDIVIDILSFISGGFLAVLICSEHDAWQRYRKKVGKDAWNTVYEKILDIEKDYALDGNIEAVNDCIKLENLMNYFKDDIKI